MIHLIVGGARSGKSRYAEALAINSGLSPVLIATALAGDEEMKQRILQHQTDRNALWRVIEEPLDLGSTLATLCQTGRIILVDCLTLWLSNCLHKNCWPQQRQALVDIIETYPTPLILVGNEVGNGVVPMGKLSRQFVDENGRLHQQLAARSSHVSTVIAGLPMVLKEPQ